MTGKRWALGLFAGAAVLAVGCNGLLDNNKPHVVRSANTAGSAGMADPSGDSAGAGARGDSESVAGVGGGTGDSGGGAGTLGGSSPDVGGAAKGAGAGGDDCSSPTGANAWRYCREVQISGAFPDIYSHQLTLGADIFSTGAVRADLSDLRFFEGACTGDESSGVGSERKPLGMWVEAAAPGGSSIVWVRTPTQAAKLAMFYGNPCASTVSDGDSAFLLFDDFSGTELDSAKWIYQPGGTTCTKDTATVADGVLSLEMSMGSYANTCSGRATILSVGSVAATSTFGIRLDMIGLHYPHWGGPGSGFRAVSSGFLDGKPQPDDSIEFAADELGTRLGTRRAGVGHVSEIPNGTTFAADRLTLRWSRTQVSWPSAGLVSTAQVPTIALSVGWRALNWDSNRPSGKVVVDAVRVMRDIEPPPTYAVGAEQAL